MQKAKKFSKQLVLLFLVLATAITAVFIANPVEVGAGAAGYQWEVKVVVTIQDGDAEDAGCYIKLHKYAKNGTDTSSVITEDVLVNGSAIFKAAGTYTYTGTTTNGEFPYQLEVSGDLLDKDSTGDAPNQDLEWTAYLKIKKADETWVEVSGYKHVEGDGAWGQSYSTIAAADYPVVTSASINTPSEIKVPTGSTSNTVDFALTNVVDQYNVNWLGSTPSLTWTASTNVNNSISFSASGYNATMSMNSQGSTGKTEDYQINVSAKTSSKTIATSGNFYVRVPHTLTIDTANGVTYPGTNPITGAYYTGDTVALQTPTKTGYDFSSWSKTAGNGSVSGSTFTFGSNNATVKPNWTPHTYNISFTDGLTTTPVTYNIESTSITLPTPAAKTGYTFTGWKVTNAAGNWANGDTVTATNINGKYGNITATAQYSPNKYSILFDSILDFDGWTDNSAGNGVVSNITENSFTLTSNAGDSVSESTFNSDTFPVTAGKTYYLNADVTGNDWDIYVFFLDASGNWLDTDRNAADGPRVSNSGGTLYVNTSKMFTAPAGAVHARLRADANGASNTVTFTDVRFYEAGTIDNDITVNDLSKEVTYDSTYGEFDSNSTKPYYDFAGWYKADGTQFGADETVKITSDTTVYSHWTPHNYSFTIDPNGGTLSADAGTYNIEAGSVPSGDIVSRTGYTFSHWEVKETVGNWTAGDKYNPGDSTVGKHGDVTLKAIWTANTYTLNFDLNKHQGAVTEPVVEPTSKKVTFDSAIGELPTPTLDGFDFVGWFKSPDSDEIITEDTIHLIAEDRTVYAHWTAHDYSFTIDPNEGTLVGDVGTYDILNGTILSGDIVTKTGYTFAGWLVSVSDGNWTVGNVYQPGDSTTGLYGDVTLKALWTANDYTVSFNTNVPDTSVSDATIDKSSMTVTYDSALNANEEMPIINRNGYTFLGWFTQAEGGEQVTAETVYTIDGDTTYYAHWQINTYTLSFNVVGGYAIDSVLYTVEDNITLPEPSKAGWDFTNWINFSATVGSWQINTEYHLGSLSIGNGHYGDVELMAMYRIKTYTITWIINGKTETSDHVFNTVPMRDDPVVTDDPEYDYVFTGWSPAIGIVTGPATYEAQFTKTPKVYTATWVDENGTTVHSESIAFGSAIPTNIAVPEKTGHTGVWANVPATMPASDLVIEPEYTPIDYTVNWIVNGAVVETDTVPYGSLPVYNGATPTRAETDEYTFDFNTWLPSIGVVVGDTDYVADFTYIPKEYTIKFVADGNTISEQKIAFGTTITNIPQVPEKFGYAGSWANIPETMPAHDVTIDAVYVQGCVVTWVVDETQYQMAFASGSQIYYDRGTPVRLATAEYTYTFAGWSETPGGEIVTTFPAATQENRTYYANFNAIPNEYTISWIADGTEVFSETLAYGSDVENIPNVPEKTGHTGVWETYPSTMPAQNVVINAVYSRISYEVKWDVNGTVTSTFVLYGDMPSYDGINTDKTSTATTDFTFIGWDKDLAPVEGEITYVAQYSESARKYTVTWRYDSEAGAIIDSYELENGSNNFYIPPVENREGHDYSYNVPEVMPTEDVTIVVVYTPKQYTITWSTPGGDIVETWSYGETPVFTGATPTKDPTPEREFDFSGWSPEISSVTGDATYVAQFSQKLRKYTITWMVDGEFHDSRLVDFGSLIPSITVPAKEGYTGVWETTFRTMPAQDITINAIYTAKKYTVYWKVDGNTIYSASVSFGDPIPKQVVPEKPGNTGVWENVPETMPAENITINAVYAPNAYEVAWRIDGVTYYDMATYGFDYLLTFDTSIPEDVRITVDGNVLSGEFFTYDASSGELKILGSAITGNIYITARAAGGKFNVIVSVENATLSNEEDTVGERTAYHTSIIPDDGYMLPDYVQVFVDGILKTEGYVYDAATGKLTINAEIVVGEIEIVFDCPLDPDYDPSNPDDDAPDTANCNCNCHSSSALSRFFFAITNFFRRIFGMDQYRYCDCGTAHW